MDEDSEFDDIELDAVLSLQQVVNITKAFADP